MRAYSHVYFILIISIEWRKQNQQDQISVDRFINLDYMLDEIQNKTMHYYGDSNET